MRPSYVLGGRAMTIVHDEEGLREAMAELAAFGSLGKEGGLSAERPVLVDRFLEDAIEVDVDAIRDHTGEVLIGGIMEHVEEAGVHSGDSACMIPPQSLPADTLAELESTTAALATELEVQGLLNVQYAVTTEADGSRNIYVLEANPRASRTVPFVAKATGRPLVKIATRVMLGATLGELRDEGMLGEIAEGDHIAVKEAVLPFNRFPETDQLLGPEMRSTGEVMGIDLEVGLAFAKAQIAAGDLLPTEGSVFFSVADRDKQSGLAAAKAYRELGFGIVATAGTAAMLSEAGVEIEGVAAKIGAPAESDEGSVSLPDAVELIESGRIQIVVNTPRGRGGRADGAYIRNAASRAGLPLFTTVAAAAAAAHGIADMAAHPLKVRPLQAYHQGVHK
jgi:carbamoyl-phosphate synthase large subunit